MLLGCRAVFTVSIPLHIRRFQVHCTIVQSKGWISASIINACEVSKAVTRRRLSSEGIRYLPSKVQGEVFNTSSLDLEEGNKNAISKCVSIQTHVCSRSTHYWLPQRAPKCETNLPATERYQSEGIEQ